MIPYNVVVFAHIASAAMLIGGSILAAPVVRMTVRRARTLQELRASLAVGRPISLIDPIAALLVLATGIYLTSVLRWWAVSWVQISTVLWVANSIAALALVKPTVDRLALGAEAALDGPVDEQLDALRWSRAWSLGVDLVLANDAAVLFLMTMKPGPTWSILVVVLVNTLVLGVGAVLRRSRVPRVKASGAPPLAPAGGE